jgi:hypothetical protein
MGEREASVMKKPKHDGLTFRLEKRRRRAGESVNLALQGIFVAMRRWRL